MSTTSRTAIRLATANELDLTPFWAVEFTEQGEMKEVSKVVSEWMHPRVKQAKPQLVGKAGRNGTISATKRTWKQRLQFTTYCSRVTDKFWTK